MDSASLCRLAGRYDKEGCSLGSPGWESIPGLHKRFTNTGSEFSENGGPINCKISLKLILVSYLPATNAHLLLLVLPFPLLVRKIYITVVSVKGINNNKNNKNLLSKHNTIVVPSTLERA